MTSYCSDWNSTETAMMDARTPREGFPADYLWKLETLGKVTEGVVHDFNNILATISGFAELILTTDGMAEREMDRITGFARMIQQAAMTGQSTVRGLSDFSRKSRIAKEGLDPHEVLRQSMAMARGALGGRISLGADFQDVPVQVHGSRSHLHNVFINLFLNARDAMPRGGDITVKTRVGEDPEGRLGYLIISVRDNGTGIPEEVKTRVFEPFFSTKGGKGSGLGLANVDATVKDHGGWITVESEPGRGTEFRIHLPLLPGNSDR
ncbi:MAG: Blue-light-activated protein [Fibrobacteres bacterium]|nr:Blue-light-activated protein [Fibrobacterota bacterium]